MTAKENESFTALVDIIDILLSPEGCPWDREQTLLSMRSSLVEEPAEAIEAIEMQDPHLLEEELGDLFFLTIFLCRLAAKEGYCSLEEVLNRIRIKLISRHPHVFDKGTIENAQQAESQWEELKKEEKKDKRLSALDGIPKTLPTLARAQKVIKKIKKKDESVLEVSTSHNDLEAEFGQNLLKCLIEAQTKGIDAEIALRSALERVEKAFRQKEKT